MVELLFGSEKLMERKSSHPSLSGENGFGESDNDDDGAVNPVKMLLVCSGLAPCFATDELQFRESLEKIFGFIRSSDRPEEVKFLRCHDGKYRTLSIWVPVRSTST